MLILGGGTASTKGTGPGLWAGSGLLLVSRGWKYEDPDPSSTVPEANVCFGTDQIPVQVRLRFVGAVSGQRQYQDPPGKIKGYQVPSNKTTLALALTHLTSSGRLGLWKKKQFARRCAALRCAALRHAATPPPPPPPLTAAACHRCRCPPLLPLAARRCSFLQFVFARSFYSVRVFL
eukprot:gene11016-biopygen19848